MKFKLILISFLFFCQVAFGQNTTNYQLIDGFEFIEVVKGNKNDKLPLLIAFHYSGAIPEETIADFDSIKTPIRIIVPKGNYKKRNGFSYYPTNYYQQDSITQFNQSKITLDSIAVFVRSIEKKYKQKAIVSGISQGGDISLLLAQYYPQLCKASFPFAAVIQSKFVEELKNKPAKKKIPIYLFQGEGDKIVSVFTTKEKIKEIGTRLDIKLYTYPNVGHEISLQMKIDYSKIIEKIK